MQFYDKDIGTGCVLCVYRDLKTEELHFVINEKRETVSFSSGAPDFCFGYVRLNTKGSNSKIQVTVLPDWIGGTTRSTNQGIARALHK